MTRRAALALPLLATPVLAQASARVVVIGGGFAGATAARTLRRADPAIAVTLIETNPVYTACPGSNEVIAGLREIDEQRFGYAGLTAAGVTVVHATVTDIDPANRIVRLDADLAPVAYDRLVLCPGVDLIWGAIPGYDEAAALRMPHAWKAGAQTLLLRHQLEAMPDGGLVVISAPANPFRCPPGPYERASLIAAYLKARKPRSKLLLLDAKDVFSKQKLFQAAWARLYPDTLTWVSQSEGGTVTSVDAQSMTVSTDFATHKADVACIIPPQRAGRAAQIAGVADRTGWCPVSPITFESRLVPNIHVIGDAAIAGAMPKSAFAANAQAKTCAVAVTDLIQGRTPAMPRLMNTCYSIAAPHDGFSVAGVYQPVDGVLTEIPGSGGPSPVDAPDSVRAMEADYGAAWFRAITHETFG
jgi:NADPH-dependent 2,4-dienoyl-CoA reductase/sulfur reductase-like enzyme